MGGFFISKPNTMNSQYTAEQLQEIKEKNEIMDVLNARHRAIVSQLLGLKLSEAQGILRRVEDELYAKAILPQQSM